MNADLNRRQRRKPRRSGGSGSSYVASSPGGTITFEVFDVHRCVIATYVGTDNTGATETDPTGGGADPNNNMVLVTSYQYDHGQAGGDGNLTEQTQYVSDSETRVTDFVYDWRNRRTATDGEIDFYAQVTYDNLDRAIKTERFDTTSSGNLVSRQETLIDNRGRVYRTIRWAVDVSTGSVGNALVDDFWFDAAGNQIKSQPAGSKLFTKTVHDGVGRQTAQYAGYDLDESTYAQAASIDDDTILQQTETHHDAASNVIQLVERQRYYNTPASQTGALGDPSTEPKARVTYTAQWHDALGRGIATAAYGTNGGTALVRPDTIPDRSDTVLVTTTGYNDAGEAFQTIDPAGREDRQFFDAAGRDRRQRRGRHGSPHQHDLRRARIGRRRRGLRQPHRGQRQRAQPISSTTTWLCPSRNTRSTRAPKTRARCTCSTTPICPHPAACSPRACGRPPCSIPTGAASMWTTEPAAEWPTRWHAWRRFATTMAVRPATTPATASTRPAAEVFEPDCSDGDKKLGRSSFLTRTAANA